MISSIYSTNTSENTLKLGEKLAKHLQPGDTVLLFGELGAGKTHFSKGIARGLGITETVKSPTFTYVNQYKGFHHYDLYRLQPDDDFTAIGLEESLQNSALITVVEWADRLAQNLPRSYVRAELEAHEDHHEIRLSFVNEENFNPEILETWYDVWRTPLHVRAHMKQVAQVAKQMGEAFVRAGEIVDLDQLYFAAIAHDMARVCDFKGMNRDHFSEEVTEEKWKNWLSLREKHTGKGHEHLAFDFLKASHPRLAEMIRLHCSTALVKEPENFDTPEKKILYYADKRVKHDQIVPLSERFRDGRERNGKDNDEATQQLYLEVEKKTEELEKELFTGLDIRPEDIR